MAASSLKEPRTKCSAMRVSSRPTSGRRPAMGGAILRVEDLHVSYGPIKAVPGCSLRVDDGEIVALIGANGAGKTTIMRAVCNQIVREKGELVFRGQSIDRTSTDQLARRGMLHIPEGRGTIGSLTVWDNLRLAYDVRPS